MSFDTVRNPLTWISGEDTHILRELGFDPDSGRISEPPNPPPKVMEQQLDGNLLISSEILWTVRTKVTMTRYQKAMVLKYLVCEAVVDGHWTWENWFMGFSLFSDLFGSKDRNLRSIRDKYDRHLAVYTLLCLRFIESSDEETRKEVLQVFQEQRLSISLSRRVQFALKPRWRADRWLSIKTEPVESLMERVKNSVRYSGYCKGYGEGGSLATRRRKSKPTLELDGDERIQPEIIDPELDMFAINLMKEISSEEVLWLAGHRVLY